MRLVVPDEPREILWEGELELGGLIGTTRSARGRPHEEPPEIAVQDLPRVSIGMPEVWRIEDLYDPGSLPPLFRSKLDEWQFRLARFVCSFRPRSDDAKVDFARFIVQLEHDEQGRQALAHDLHPRAVLQERKKSVTMTLKPTLTFGEVGASLGSGGFSLEYDTLEPVISASGAGEDLADWSYEGAKGIPIVGSKWMHMIIRAPISMDRCTAQIDMTADLRLKSWLFGARLKAEQEHRRRQVPLW